MRKEVIRRTELQFLAMPSCAPLVALVMLIVNCHAASAPPPRAAAPPRGGAPGVDGKAKAGAVGVDDFVAGVFDDGAGHKLPYRLYAPRGFDPARKIPLVVFLHGAGGRGTDNRGQLTDQAAPLVFVQPENQAKWPAFMLAPQCPPDQKWVDMPWGAPSGKGKQPAAPTWPMAAMLALVDQLRTAQPAIDPAQTFVTGMSMGGYGAWDAAVRHPAKWKAAVIVCGGYDELAVAPIVRLPVWAFHAVDDTAVPVARSRDMIAALKVLGGTPRYTEYPASAHHGHFSWRPAYADPDLLPWMFGSRQSSPPPPLPAP